MSDTQTASRNAERMAEGYEPRWDIDAAVGRRGEAYVVSVLDEYANGSVEVKCDERALTTGNVYVEYECKGNPSGLSTSEASAWAFVLGDAVVFVPADKLIRLARDAYTKGRRAECTRGSHPTRGVLIAVADLYRPLKADLVQAAA